MDKKILLSLSIAFLISNISYAEMTVQEARNEEYLINHGHSKEMARLLNLNRSQVLGESKKKEEKKLMSWPVRMYKKIHAYIDPAIDDGTFGQHEIHNEPAIEDL